MYCIYSYDYFSFYSYYSATGADIIGSGIKNGLRNIAGSILIGMSLLAIAISTISKKNNSLTI